MPDINVKTQIEVIIEAAPAEGMSLLDLVGELKAAGNEILSIDFENRKVKIVHFMEE